jgi:hypothetical protein
LTARAARRRAFGHRPRLSGALPRALLVAGVILLGAAYFLPPSVRVTRTIVVARPAASVAALLASRARFREWSPWAEPSTAAAAETTPTVAADGLLGATLALAGLPPVASQWRLSDLGAVTLVEWSLEVEVGSDPLSRYRGVLVGQRLGRDAARGLAQLQLLAERQPTAR